MGNYRLPIFLAAYDDLQELQETERMQPDV